MLSDLDIGFNSLDFHIFSDSLGDSINIITSSLDCYLVAINPYKEFIYFRFFWQALNPVLLIMVQITTYLISAILTKRIKFSSRDLFFIIMNVYIFLFTSITNSIMSHFSCRFKIQKCNN